MPPRGRSGQHAVRVERRPVDRLGALRPAAIPERADGPQLGQEGKIGALLLSHEPGDPLAAGVVVPGVVVGDPEERNPYRAPPSPRCAEPRASVTAVEPWCPWWRG